MELELVYNKLSSPITLLQCKDYIYIGDQNGIIYRSRLSQNQILDPNPEQHLDQSLDLEVFLDFTDLLLKLEDKYDERGLLNFAFHPKFPEDNRLFVFYSVPWNSNYANFLSEITISQDDEKLETKTLLVVSKEEKCHNGGRVSFDTQGYLYLALGDGCPQKDPNNHAQRLDVLYGKVLRMDISTPGILKVPTDNPFVDVKEANPLIYAYGFRNPWGISFNNQDQMILADVGFETIEEIDIVIKGGNYGWNIKEGTKLTEFPREKGVTEAVVESLIDPIFEYTHDWVKDLPMFGIESDPTKKSIAIIGGYSLPDDSYVFGDLSGLIMRIKANSEGVWELLAIGTVDKFIKAFGKDSSDNIYVLCSNTMSPKGEGEIYKIKFK